MCAVPVVALVATAAFAPLPFSVAEPGMTANVLGANKGEGLLFARGVRLRLTIEASPAEHRLATTAPRELAELRKLEMQHAPAH